MYTSEEAGMRVSMHACAPVLMQEIKTRIRKLIEEKEILRDPHLRNPTNLHLGKKTLSIRTEEKQWHPHQYEENNAFH